jgi:hypothetical protein
MTYAGCSLPFGATNQSLIHLLLCHLGRGQTKETGNRNATAISDNCYQPELNTCYWMEQSNLRKRLRNSRKDWETLLSGNGACQSYHNCVAVWFPSVRCSSICAALISNMCSTQADNNSRKLRLRCDCQFPWCALGLTVVILTVYNFQFLLYIVMCWIRKWIYWTLTNRHCK